MAAVPAGRGQREEWSPRGAYELLRALHPPWHARAACAGVGANEFTIEQGQGTTAGAIRREFCSVCPVAGHCLREGAEELEPPVRRATVRCGVVGQRPWAGVMRLIEELEPVTDEDWQALAAMVLAEPPTRRKRRDQPLDAAA